MPTRAIILSLMLSYTLPAAGQNSIIGPEAVRQHPDDHRTPNIPLNHQVLRVSMRDSAADQDRIASQVLLVPRKEELADRLKDEIKQGSCDKLSTDSCRVKLSMALESVKPQLLLDNPLLRDEWTNKITDFLLHNTVEAKAEFKALMMQTQKKILKESDLVASPSAVALETSLSSLSQEEIDLLKKNTFTLHEILALVDIALAVGDDDFLNSIEPVLNHSFPELSEAIQCFQRNMAPRTNIPGGELTVRDVLGGTQRGPQSNDLIGPISGVVAVSKGFADMDRTADVDKDGYTPAQRLVGGILGAINLNLKSDTPQSYMTKIIGGLVVVRSTGPAGVATAVAAVGAGMIVGVMEPSRFGVDPKTPVPDAPPNPPRAENSPQPDQSSPPQRSDTGDPAQDGSKSDEHKKDEEELKSDTRRDENHVISCNASCQSTQELFVDSITRVIVRPDISAEELQQQQDIVASLEQFKSELIQVKRDPQKSGLDQGTAINETFRDKQEKCLSFRFDQGE